MMPDQRSPPCLAPAIALSGRRFQLLKDALTVFKVTFFSVTPSQSYIGRYYLSLSERRKVIVERVRNIWFNSKIKYCVNTDEHGHFVAWVVEARTVSSLWVWQWVCCFTGNICLFIVSDKQATLDLTFGEKML